MGTEILSINQSTKDSPCDSHCGDGTGYSNVPVIIMPFYKYRTENNKLYGKMQIPYISFVCLLKEAKQGLNNDQL